MAEQTSQGFQEPEMTEEEARLDRIARRIIILSRSTILTRSTVRTISTLSLHLVALYIHKPVTVYGPVIDTVFVLCHTDNRSYTVCTVGTVSAILTIGSMLDDNGFAIFKLDDITNIINRSKYKIYSNKYIII